MRSSKQSCQKLNSAEKKAAARRALNAVVDDINKHKLAWAVVCLLHGWLLGMILLTPMFTLTGAICFFTELALLVLTVNTLIQSALRPGRVVHEWALEQKKHEDIKKLTGRTTEELEAMLQYHMEQGNIEEADRVSQKLLASVEGHPMPDAVAVSADPGVVLKVKASADSNLPGWLKDGSEDEQLPEEESANLPDWMRKQ